MLPLKLSLAICDDQAMQVKINTKYVTEIAERNDYDLTVCGFTDFQSLCSYMDDHPVDIVLLDIDLGNASGIQGAMDLFHKFPSLLVIFATSYREFAYEAFDMEAFGYLLKPINPSKLERTLLKAVAQLEYSRKAPVVRYHTFTVDKNPLRIAETDIFYVERVLARVEIITSTGNHRIYSSIKALAEQLGNGFIQISQSTLVRIAEIKDIKDHTLYTKHGAQLTISRKNRKEVMQAFFHQA